MRATNDALAVSEARIRELEAALQEANETLDAIRNGDVDAVVIGSPQGQIVYTLESADRPYRVLVEQMREGAVTLNGQGTILYCNRSFAELIGRRSEDIVGKPIFTFVWQAAELEAMLTDAGPLGSSAELSLIVGDGGLAQANMSVVNMRVEVGEARMLCLIVTDLRQHYERGREVAEANLRLASEIAERTRAEQSLAIALDAADMGSWDLRIASDDSVRSPRHDAIFGYPQPRAHWDAKDAAELFLPEDRKDFTDTMARAAITGHVDIERRIRRANDGAVRWVQIKGRTFFRDGQPERIVGIIVDNTDRRQLDEALRQAQKMEAIGQLTGGIAHDFNNLLAGISGSLELMQTRMQQGRLTDVDRYMTAAQGAARRAAALTHRLLAFSRRQTLEPKPTDVNRLVSGMHEMIQRTVGPGIPIEVVGASGAWPALVDPPQLESALLNLCINARDAMPDGGSITVETANKWFDERAGRLHEMPEGQYLSLCVTDTGVGMSPEVIARAFEPFFTTKPIGEGTGLGLSMIYGFAQQSGGQVRIYSEIGKGTTVCIYLPRYYGEVEADMPAKAEPLTRTEQGEAVLVVDDEPTVRMLISDILEDLGYTAIEAADSAAGLKVLQSDVRIDLLVTDVGLPGGMNGRQMADAGRASRPDLKVLFITGYAENAILGKAHLEPGMAVLTKPFAIETMAARIRSMIEATKDDARARRAPSS